MAAADYIPLVQSLYISYFGRPADTLGAANFAAQLDALHAPTDVNGLTAAYKSNTGIKALIDSFGTSAESNALYTGDNVAFVTAIYANVLNRTPDFDGLIYWATEINAGRLTKANASLAIMAGAYNNVTEQGLLDKAVLEAKVAIATAFTAAIDTAPELSAYSGAAAAAAAREMLKTVTATSTAAGYAATIDATLVQLVADSIPTTTHDLTASVDNFVGTTGNNIINGNDTTYTALDKIDGGAGNDKLVLSDVGGGDLDLSDATVVNVETLELTSTENLGGNAADLSAWTGLTKATLLTKTAAGQTVMVGKAVDLIINNTGVADYTITGGNDVVVKTGGIISLTGNGGLATVAVTGGSTVTINDGANDTLTTVSLDGNTSSATITSDKLTTLSITDTAQATTVVAAAGTRALGVTLDTATGALTDATATSVALTVVGAASSIALNAAAATAVTIAGDKDLTVAHTAAALTSITSTSTGNVTLTNALGAGVAYTGAAGVDTLSVGATTKAVKTGAGADSVTVTAAALGTGGSIDAGDGTDTLNMTSAIAAAATASATFAASISGFEKVSLGSTTVNNTVVLSNLDNINYVQSAGTASGSATVAPTAEVTTVTVSGVAAHADTVTFDGQVIALTHGFTAAQTAAAIAAGVYTNYTVTADGAVLTVTNKSTGNPADLTAGSFTFFDGLATGQTAGAVATTVQGVTAAGAIAATAEQQEMTIAGAATGPVAFLGTNVPNTNVGSTPAQVGAEIILAKAAIIAKWNTDFPARELADITLAGTTLTLVYADTEGNVEAMAGAVSNGIGFGNASTTVEGSLAIPAVTAVKEVFTLTLTGPAVGADTIAFDGVTVNTIVDGDSAATIAGKIATFPGGFPNWVATVADNVVTFTAMNAGAQPVDQVIGNFTFFDQTVSGTQSVAITTVVDGGAGTVGTAATLTLSDLASAGTLEINNGGTYVVGVKDAATGTADSLNVVLKSAATIGTGPDFITVTAANVETVNITNTDSNSTVHQNIATLVATSAKTIVVTGNAGLNLTNTGNTKVTSFDASGVTAASPILFTSANDSTTASVSIKGGAGADVLTGNVGSDTIVGGAGVDIIDGKGGVNTLTGGAGNDVFTFTVKAESAVKASTITDLTAGDSVVLTAAIVDGDGKMGAAVTGLDATTAVFQDFVDAAVAGVGLGAVAWFQFQGNTYIVQDLIGDSLTFSNTDDSIVKITGNVDLTASTIAGSTITIV